MKATVEENIFEVEPEVPSLVRLKEDDYNCILLVTKTDEYNDFICVIVASDDEGFIGETDSYHQSGLMPFNGKVILEN